MNSLIFSLNATIPIFLIMIVGMFLKKINIINEEFNKGLNKIVFSIALPILLFEDVSSVDFIELWDTKFVLFCFIATLISILISYVISLFLKNKNIQGEFIQGSYRSSASIIGIAFVQNIYGNIGASPLMIIGAVPLYNIAAVIILSIFKPNKEKLDRKVIKSTFIDILKNPIILGILFGILWSLSRLSKPVIMDTTLENLANLATPLGLISIGASFDFKKAVGEIKPTIICAVLKLIVFCALFLPLGVYMGYRNDYLVTILVMLGSATTVSSFIMAKNMGHEGILSSSTVMITTLLSSFTLTMWLFILKTLNLI